MARRQKAAVAAPATAADPAEAGQTRRQPWNRSTRLRPDESATKAPARRDSPGALPRRARSAQSKPTRRSPPADKHVQDDDAQPNDDDEQQTLTRELLERAVSTAFGGLLQDSALDAAAFPDVCASSSSGHSSMRDQENQTPPAERRTIRLETKLQTSLQASEALSASHRERRRQHAEVSLRATADARATKEFHRRMKLASFEHRERKLAVQALQARVQREIQFLTATAADLDKREFLLDDAFESFEHALRLELGLDASQPQS